MSGIEENYIIEEEKSLKWENLAQKLQQEQPRTRYLPEYKNIKCVLYNDDPFVGYWNMLIIILLLYTATVTPYRMTLQEADSLEYIIIDLIIDGLYFFDTILNCFTAYLDLNGVLVTDKWKIFKNYLTGWLLIDIASCFPAQVIFQTSKNYSKLIRVGRLPRLYKLIKMAKLIRMFKIIKSRSQILKYIGKIYKVDAAVERLVWFLMTFLLMIHILACIWIFIGIYYIDDTENTWIMRCGVIDLSELELYVTGLYWCVTTLATVGYGDIHPYSTSERLYTSGVMVIGIFIYSYIIGSLTNLLSNVDSRRAKLNRKLEILDNLTREYGFNQNFYKKLNVALEYQHLNSKQDLSDLIEDIPGNLRVQLLVVIYQKILESNAFFIGKPSFFVAYVAPLLKPVRYDEGEYIYRQYEYAKEMFFIVKGEVEMIIAAADDVEVQFNTLSGEYYFGETDILFSEGKERSFSVKSLGSCELLSLDHTDFENMLKKFEEESIEIMTLAHQRNQRLENKKNEALQKYFEKTELRKIRSFPALFTNDNVNIADLLNASKSNLSKSPSFYPEDPVLDFGSTGELIPGSNFFSFNPKLSNSGNGELLSNKTLYNIVIEEKLVKEEDNLKIAKKKIIEVERMIEDCLSIIKNITEFFGIEDEGLMHFH